MLPKPRIHQTMELSEHVKAFYSQDMRCPNSFLKLPNLFSMGHASVVYEIPDIANTKFRAHAKNYVCSSCQQSFKTSQGLNQHIGKVHSNAAKTEPCPMCDKLFKHKYAVEFHLAQVHYESTRAICQVCDKKFYNKYELQKHYRARHPDFEINQ